MKGALVKRKDSGREKNKKRRRGNSSSNLFIDMNF